MKAKCLLALVSLSLVLGLVFASPALAGRPDKRHHDPRHSWNGNGYGHTKGARGNGQVPPGHVPELDPGLLGSAAVLLIGGTLVLHGRRRIETKA